MKTSPCSFPLRIAAACIAASALATTASLARPLVTFDVIAVPVGLTGSSTPGLSISPDGLSVQFYPGTHADILLRLVATPNSQNGNPNDEGFTQVFGSFVTVGTTGNLTGSMRGDALVTPGVNNVDPFRSGLSFFVPKSGSNAELSGLIPGNAADAILDIGGSGTTQGSPPDFFPGYFASAASQSVGGQSFILGETLLSLDGTEGSTSVQFVPRTAVGGLNNQRMVQFTLDGVTLIRNGNGALQGSANPPDPTAFAFHSVTVRVVPEPGALGMLLGGALALVARRRRKK